MPGIGQQMPAGVAKLVRMAIPDASHFPSGVTNRRLGFAGIPIPL
jgi:hypothetical protein